MKPRKYCKFRQSGYKKSEIVDVSLHDVMNRLASGQADDFAVMSDTDALICVDALAANLHRQYMSAQSQYQKLIRENGADDAMAEIAMDVMQSAKSALDTRLIELRRENDVMGQVIQLQKQDIEDKRAARGEEKRAYALMVFRRAEMLSKAQEKKKHSDMFGFWVLMMMWMGIGPFQYLRPSAAAPFNRLAA